MHKISVNLAQPGMIVGKPVLGGSGQILLNAGISIKPQHIFYIKQLGIESIYIQDDRLADVVIKDVVNDQVRSESRALIAQIMLDVDSPSPNNKGINVRDKEIVELVAKIIEELIENKDLMVQLVDIRSKDSYLFAHSVNCAVLSTLMAVKLNLDSDCLKAMASGALLHDLGMIAVPQKVINKAGELTKDEFDMVKQHPVYGYELFKESSLFSPQAGAVILHHHERNQGQGYPYGLQGNELSRLVKIMMVADIFDALTSDKPHRRAYQTHQAVEMLMSWGGEVFDIDTLRHFLSNIAAYPAGTHVMLNNGESGLVVANTTGYALRPVIKIFYKGNDLSPHPRPYEIDLKTALNLTVSKVLEDVSADDNKTYTAN
jgi:HD-GYP domain-containing protein (c-di-GMP phosphodiesterase class II)